MMLCLLPKKVQLCYKLYSIQQLIILHVYICVFLIFPSFEARKHCQREYSTIKGTNETILWVDSSVIQNPIIFSNPICLDQNDNAITRICFEGEWIPKESPICFSKSTNEYCPYDFFEYRGFCINNCDKTTKKKKAFVQQENILNSENTKTITICDKILVPSDVEIQMKLNKPVGSGNCTSCTDMHEKASNNVTQCRTSNYVTLPYDHRFHVCPENCSSPDLTSDKCYCKIIGIVDDIKLVDVKNDLQRKAISKLVEKDICRIRNDDDDFFKNYQKVITRDFIGYTTNSTKCSVIETKTGKKFEPPSMMLNFDEKRRKLSLLIENSEGISPSKYYFVQCYTNAGYDLLRSAHIRKIREIIPERFSIYDVRLERFVGEYWCEAFSLNLTKIQTNTILAWRERDGHEYSLRVRIRNITSFIDPFQKEVHLDSLQWTLTNDIRRITRTEVRVMKINDLSLNGADIILHLTTRNSNETLKEYERIDKSLMQLPVYIEVLNFKAVDVCLPEETNEFSQKLHWEIAGIWERKTPKELCLQKNGIPVMRTCIGNFISGAYWSDLTEKCEENMEIPSVTQFLNEKLYSYVSIEDFDAVSAVTRDTSLSYLDIYLCTELMKRMEIDEEDSTDQEKFQNVFNMINILSKENKTQLKSSQALFNATDTLLLLLDEQSLNAPSEYFELNDSFQFSGENILIIIVKPFETNISGIYLLGDENAPLNQLNVNFLLRNETIYDINSTDLDSLNIAANIPEEILESIENDYEDPSEIYVVYTIFYEDSLFIDSTKRSASKVMSVIISGYGGYLNNSIPLVMKSTHPEGGNCGYWNFGQKLQRRKGEWSSFGGKYHGNFMNHNDLHVCQFSHLTHFALLIVSESIKVDEGDQEITELSKLDEETTSFYLTVITIIGGTLSGIGILGIYLTAIIFSTWREKDGTKILLNLSTAILLEIVFLQFSGANGIGYDRVCKLIGCLLHYTLLSKFCWMFIYALLQYRRFVKVLGVQPKKLILKSMFFGWGFAVLPVSLTLLISSDSYSKTNICYLHGFPLYIAVIFPVSIIITANLIVFIIVMYHVSTKKVESTVETKFSILQLYLAILLYSVLGLPWLFAILAEFVSDNILKVVLMYLFCLTGTIQGFILFVFYVLVNEETRQKWSKYFNNKCFKLKYQK